MESPLSVFRMPWDHEPIVISRTRPSDTLAPAAAASALVTVANQPAFWSAAGSEAPRRFGFLPRSAGALQNLAAIGRFMESLHGFDAVYWHHERFRAGARTVVSARTWLSALRFMGREHLQNSDVS